MRMPARRDSWLGPRRGHLFAGVSLAALLLLAAPSCRKKGVPLEAFQAIATSLGSAPEEIDSVRIYLDASASMRGFALAASRNEAGTSAPFQSLLAGLDSIGDEVAARTADSPKQEKGSERKGPLPAKQEIHRFGSLLEPLPPGVSLVSAPLGRASVKPAGGRDLPPEWVSKDCSAKWGGSAETRLAIDSFFSETSTCLNQVFDEVAASEVAAGEVAAREAGKRAFVILTDAEQLAPEGSERCPAARSAGTIQARIDEWIRVKRRFAAVVAFRIGYLPWEAKAAGKRYCGCGERLLFAYILTPGPETAEKIHALLARSWKGSPDALTYLPLVPRPASEFDVEVSLPYEGKKKPALFPTAYPKSLQEPRLSNLPVFPIEMKDDKALVAVQVKKAGFERPEARSSPGFARLDWSQARFTWREVSTRFVLERGKKKTGFVPLSGAGGVEILLQTEAAKEGDQVTRRTGRFQGRATVLPGDQTTDKLPRASFIVKRAPGKHGSEAFLIELVADSTPLVANLWKDSPLIGKAPSECIKLASLEEQLQLAGRTSPVVRFLLHVDY